VGLARRIVQQAGAARERGVAPESVEGARVLDRVLGGDPDTRSRAELLGQLEIVTDPRGSGTGGWWA
jgi:hypothetical protein